MMDVLKRVKLNGGDEYVNVKKTKNGHLTNRDGGCNIFYAKC